MSIQETKLILNEDRVKSGRTTLVDGYGDLPSLAQKVAKRDKFDQLRTPDAQLASPETKGFDRFGLDCLALLEASRSLGSTAKDMAKEFEDRCVNAESYMQTYTKIDNEYLRMASVFFVPVALWFLLHWLGLFSWHPIVKFLAAVVPFYIGLRMHRSLMDDLDDTVPSDAIYITTFLTRNGLTREDIKRNPNLLVAGLVINEKIQKVIRYQVIKKINDFPRVLGLGTIPVAHYFKIPEFPGSSSNQFWGQLARTHNAVMSARNRGVFERRDMGPANVGIAAAAIGTGAYAADASMDHFAVPDYSHYTGLDNAGFPQVNVDGTPMIDNSGIDIHGHAYGQTQDF